MDILEGHRDRPAARVGAQDGQDRAGPTTLRFGDHDVAFAELPPELQRRFTLDTLLDTARAYGARVRADDVHDRARQPAPP